MFKSKCYYDSKTKLRPNFEINDNVYVKNILNNKWQQAVIIKNVNNRSYLVRMCDSNKMYQRNKKFIRVNRGEKEININDNNNMNDVVPVTLNDSFLDKKPQRSVNKPNYLNITSFKSKSYV